MRVTLGREGTDGNSFQCWVSFSTTCLSTAMVSLTTPLGTTWGIALLVFKTGMLQQNWPVSQSGPDFAVPCSSSRTTSASKGPSPEKSWALAACLETPGISHAHWTSQLGLYKEGNFFLKGRALQYFRIVSLFDLCLFYVACFEVVCGFFCAKVRLLDIHIVPVYKSLALLSKGSPLSPVPNLSCCLSHQLCHSWGVLPGRAVKHPATEHLLEGILVIVYFTWIAQQHPFLSIQQRQEILDFLSLRSGICSFHVMCPFHSGHRAPSRQNKGHLSIRPSLFSFP